MKRIIGGLIGLSLMFPGFTGAVTIGELQAQINNLLAMVAQLQTQLATQTGSSGSGCYSFSADLKVGDRGIEVARLHTALEKDGFSIPDSEKPQKDGETVNDTYFGEATASKVSAFQEKYRSEILTPAGLSNGTGYLGARTRAKLNALYGCGTSTNPQLPTYPIQPIACTMEAKLCSDGKTYVGRTGPKCEFSACPTTSTSNLYVTLDGSSPSSQTINSGSSNVNVGSFKISSQNGDTTIQNIRFGVTTYPFCPGKSYSLYDGNTLLSSVANTDSGCNFFFNNLNYTVPSNTAKVLHVKMDFLPGTMPEKFAIQMKEVGTKYSSKISGLPVNANPVTITASTDSITSTMGLCTTLSKNWGETYVDVEGGSITKNGVGYVVDGANGVSAGANQTMNFYAYLPDGHSKGQVSVTYPNTTEDSYIKARGILIASITSGSNPSNPNSPYGGVIKNIDSKLAKCPSYTRTTQTPQAPTVSYIEPTSASVGATVYVYGSNFNNATFVGIDGVNGVSAQPTSISVISANKLSFVVPSISIGTHTVAVAEKAGPWDLSSPVSLNIVASPTTVTKPDLIVGATACEPLNINVNENKIFCQVTVWNNSSVDITKSFDVNIQGSAVTINGLKAQERKTVKNPSPFGFSVAGSHTLNFPIDIWNSVDESDENNNSHSMTISIGNATQTPTGNLSFYKTSLNFSYTKGGGLPPLQLLTFTNNSNVNISYNLSVPNKPSWLNASYATDTLTISPGTPTSVLATVSPENLNPGSYSTNLVISGNFTGSPIYIPINLIVN